MTYHIDVKLIIRFQAHSEGRSMRVRIYVHSMVIYRYIDLVYLRW